MPFVRHTPKEVKAQIKFTCPDCHFPAIVNIEKAVITITVIIVTCPFCSTDTRISTEKGK